MGGVIGGSRWRTASSDAFGHGFSRGARNTASATRPPGFIARRTFAKAAIGSSKNITPRQERQIKAAGGKGMGSAGGAARRCARGS